MRWTAIIPVLLLFGCTHSGQQQLQVELFKLKLSDILRETEEISHQESKLSYLTPAAQVVAAEYLDTWIDTLQSWQLYVLDMTPPNNAAKTAQEKVNIVLDGTGMYYRDKLKAIRDPGLFDIESATARQARLVPNFIAAKKAVEAIQVVK